MGNSSSHTHEPLERGFTRGGKFGDVQSSVSKSLEYFCGFFSIEIYFIENNLFNLN